MRTKTKNNEKSEEIRLHASAAGVWTVCAGSVELLAQNRNNIMSLPPMAARGVALHSVAADLLLDKKPENKDILSDEDLSAVLYYVQHVKETSTSLKKKNSKNYAEFIEQKIEQVVSNVMFVAIPDCAIVAGDTVTIIDLKTGYVPVPADNLQNKIYAHVIAKEMLLRGIKIEKAHLQTVMTSTRQVNFASLDIDPDFLQTLAEDFFARRNELLTGQHCRMCNAVTYCPELKKQIDKLKSPTFREKILRDESSFAEWWTYKKAIEKFYEQLEREIFTLADFGSVPSGLKIVEASGRRQWAANVEPKVLAKKLKLKLADITEQKLLTPPQLEKKLGALPEGAEEFIVRPQSRSIYLDRGGDEKFD